MINPMSIIPLAMSPENSRAIIVQVMGGRGLTRRLEELGLLPGTEVLVLKSYQPGPLLISVRGSRLALGRGIAMKIFVKVSHYGY